MSSEKIAVDTIVSPPFMENSLIVRVEGRDDCLVVDPGFEPEAIAEKMAELGVEPAMVLLTHGHADHIAGNGYFKERWPDVPLVIGSGDAGMLTDPRANLSALAGGSIVSPPADRTVDEGDVFEAAGISLRVLEIPGHSAGHVVFVIEQSQPNIVLGGDVLFQGSIGRFDFPGGNERKLLDGIRTKLYTLPDVTIVYPGHGPPTTTGEEKRANPFVHM